MFRDDNIYKLLGIREYVSPGMVKKSFRQFAKQHHPDFFPDDRLKEEKFKRVCSAYNKWRVFQNTIEEIKRLKTSSVANNSEGFKPWSFCHVS
jgi:curved DNA-binding protein CbpA